MAKRRQPSRRRFRSPLSARKWIALGTLTLVGFLYYQPLRRYLDAREQVAVRAAEVDRLKAKRRVLERRLRDRATDAELTREARKLGYVRPGERLFIVKGITGWQRARARERAAHE
jgi:cell division protein FtsB